MTGHNQRNLNLIFQPIVLDRRSELAGIQIPLVKRPIHPQREFARPVVNGTTDSILNAAWAILRVGQENFSASGKPI